MECKVGVGQENERKLLVQLPLVSDSVQCWGWAQIHLNK